MSFVTLVLHACARAPLTIVVDIDTVPGVIIIFYPQPKEQAIITTATVKAAPVITLIVLSPGSLSLSYVLNPRRRKPGVTNGRMKHKAYTSTH